MILKYAIYILFTLSAFCLNGSTYQDDFSNFMDTFPKSSEPLYSENIQTPIFLTVNHDVDVDMVDFFLNGKLDTPKNREQLKFCSYFQKALEFESAKLKKAQCLGAPAHYGFDISLSSTNEKIGYVAVEHLRNAIYLSWITINTNHRKHGYTKHVLTILEEAYKSRKKSLPTNCRSFFLNTTTNNPLAKAALNLDYVPHDHSHSKENPLSILLVKEFCKRDTYDLKEKCLFLALIIGIFCIAAPCTLLL